MKKLLPMLLLAVLFLSACSANSGQLSTEELERQWNAQYNLIAEGINAVEESKGNLQAEWLKDLKGDPQLKVLADPESGVQKNILERKALLENLKPLLSEAHALLQQDAAAAGWAEEHARLTKYVDDSLALLAEESSFFSQLSGEKPLEADAQYLLSDLNGKWSRIRQIFEPEAPAEEAPPAAVKEARYRIDPDTYLVEALGEQEANPLLLTFDDVPGSGESQHALKIANALKERGAGAIFFVYQAQLQSPAGSETIRRLAEMGFALGNHSMHHYDLTQLSEEEIREEIRGISDQVEELTGQRPRFFRPPYGIMNEAVVRIAKEEGMITLNWTYGYDWEDDYQEPDALRKIMVETPYLRSGANLLMHDRSNTAEALPGILSDLEAKGYHFVDPGEIAHE